MAEFERRKCDSIWIGRDLGYRGGRRTGIALTDEIHLPMLSNTLGGANLQKATTGGSMMERTAQEIWRAAVGLKQMPFFWNVFPLHPHEPGDPLSNRCHSERERRTCEFAVSEIVDWLQPNRIIALGNDAFRVLSATGVHCIPIRHPSYGGQARFRSEIQDVFGVEQQ
jgi:hypothetical protein